MGKCARLSALFAIGILAVSVAFCASYSLGGKVYADTLSSPTPVLSSAPKHTILPGISRSVLKEAEKCQTSSNDQKCNYVVLNNSGEWINTGNVSLGCENGASYTLNEMQLSLAIKGEKADRGIEVRLNSPDGPIVGNLDLSGSVSSSFTQKTLRLSCSGEDGVPTQVQFYLVYKGEGSVKINWIYVTRTNAIQVPVPPIEPPTLIIGDLDRDDSFTAVDFALLRKYLLNTNLDVPIDYWLEVGDVDGDGELTAIDFALFRKRLLGLIDKFPIEIDETIIPKVNITADKAKEVTSSSAYINGKIEFYKSEEATISVAINEFWHLRDTYKEIAFANFSPAIKGWGNLYLKLNSLKPETMYQYHYEHVGSYDEINYTYPKGAYAIDSFTTKAADSDSSKDFDTQNSNCSLKALAAVEVTYKSAILGGQIDLTNNEEGVLKIEYWEKEKPQKRMSVGTVKYSTEESYFDYGGTFFALADGLNPETEYEYQLVYLPSTTTTIISSDVMSFKTITKTGK